MWPTTCNEISEALRSTQRNPLSFTPALRDNGSMEQREDYDQLQKAGKEHLCMHFSRHGVYDDAHDIPVIVKGDGMYIWDSRGKRYLDGLAGLFVVQVGH